MAGVAAIGSALWRLTGMPKHVSILRSERKNPQAEIHLSDWLLIYVSLIVAGIAFLSAKSWAVHMLAASCIVLLLVAARGAWNTLVKIAVIRSKQNESAQQQKAKTA